MAKFAAKDSNKNITLSPHGTGKVVVGTGAADATVQSDGNHNLVLQTGNSTTGSISITDGADGDIAITPNGTGNLVVGTGGAAGKITSNGAHDLRIDTNSGTNSGNITITDAADGNISLTPNGTGEIVIGSGSASGKITSSGAHDLVLDTNSGTNSGSITITDGADGTISITPNGAGDVYLPKVNIDSGNIDATDVNMTSGTLTTTTAQKTAIVDGGKGNLTKSDVGLGNVTNESKATMFTSPTFTGSPISTSIQPASSQPLTIKDEGGTASLTVQTDGDLTVAENIEQADGKNIQTDEVRARDGDGLKLYDDGGNGVKVVDNGYLDLKMYSDPGGTNFIKTQYTASVSTSAVTIATAGNFLTYGTFFVICGRDTASSADRFVDLITASLNGQVNIVAQTTARASPKTRTYSLSGDNLQLAMGSGTYRVLLTAFDFHTDT